MKILAPAKINLYLEILCRDRNGYHRIETIFQEIGLFDKIILTETARRNVQITCYNEKGKIITSISNKKNIIYKAVELLRKKSGIQKGVKIEVYKKIPMAAGLGGGSSDAAAVLKGLNRLWKLAMKKHELTAIARKIGSDVPFFLSGHTALGEGYGDIITRLPRMNKRWVLLANPGFEVSTKTVYSRISRKLRLTKAINVNKISAEKARELLRSNIKKLLFNRLEEVAIIDYPVISRLKKYLIANGAVSSLMSGSGPTVFAFINSRSKGEALMMGVKKVFGFPSWLVQTR